MQSAKCGQSLQVQYRTPYFHSSQTNEISCLLIASIRDLRVIFATWHFSQLRIIYQLIGIKARIMRFCNHSGAVAQSRIGRNVNVVVTGYSVHELELGIGLEISILDN